MRPAAPQPNLAMERASDCWLPIAMALGAAKSTMRTLNAFLFWLLILVLAVLNGGLREAVLIPNLGRSLAFVLSGLLLSACILAVAFTSVPRVSPLSTKDALSLGFFWLLLTLVFEFGFGLLVQGKSWSLMLEAYMFREGNIWPIVLAVTLLAPLLVTRAYKRVKQS